MPDQPRQLRLTCFSFLIHFVQKNRFEPDFRIINFFENDFARVEGNTCRFFLTHKRVSTWTLGHFRASKSVVRRILCSSGTSTHGFRVELFD